METKKTKMIDEKGNLDVTVKCEDVTWFSFLDFSRFTNHLNGGWNSNEYWRDRGLNSLKMGFIQKWTARSLSLRENLTPRPRRQDFRFDRPERSEPKADLLSDHVPPVKRREAWLN